MFKKFSNAQLLLAIIVLVLLVAAVFYFDSKKGESTFKTELVEIDSAKVSAIYIYPKSEQHKEIKITKRGEEWTVEMEGKKSARSSMEMVSYVIKQLQMIKPKRLAATDESKWKDFQVDTTGTRVKVMEGDKMSLNIVIGKFSYQQDQNQMNQMMGQRGGGQMTSYVRLADDKNVYAAEGFLDMSFNRDFDAWRDKTIIKSNFNGWTKLTFTYPDSSFTLTKVNDKWTIDGITEPDSVKLISYAQSIANLNGGEVVDNFSPTQPIFTLNIESSDKQNITVNAYPSDTISHYILTSSLNPNTYFTSKNKIHEKVFVGEGKFLKGN